MSLEIGERRRAEADLRTAEHRYRLLAEQIPAVTYIWEPDLLEAPPQYYTSPRIEQLLGYTVDEWHATEDFWMSRLHPDDRTGVLAATLRSETTGEPFAMEFRYLHKDGRIVWVADQAILISRHDGRPRLFQGVMIDVTGRKEAENAAAESELRYRDLTEQIPGVIYTAELHPAERGYRLRYVSPQLTEIFGYGPEDWATTETGSRRCTRGSRTRARDRRTSPRRTGSRSSTGSSTATAPSDGSAIRRTCSGDALGRPNRDPGTRRRHDGRPTDRPGAPRGPDPLPLARRGDPGHHLRRARDPEAPEESRFAFVSPQIEEILGFTPEEATSDPFFFERTLHPDDLPRIRAANAGRSRPASRSTRSSDRSPRTARSAGCTTARSWSATTTARRASGTA